MRIFLANAAMFIIGAAALMDRGQLLLAMFSTFVSIGSIAFYHLAQKLDEPHLIDKTSLWEVQI